MRKPLRLMCNMHVISKASIFIFFIIFASTTGFSQNSQSADEFLKAAQKAIRQDKDYPLAIRLLKQALVISPDYSDVRVMLGRIYTWNNFPDSARVQFAYVLSKKPGDEEASNASFDLEYWNNNPTKALQIADLTLTHHPQSEEMLIKKAKVLNSMNRKPEAIALVLDLSRKNPLNQNFQTLLKTLRGTNLKNDIGYTYTFSSFDKRFDTPWHMASITYGRFTPVGTLNFQVNYANRFSANGVEFETNSYPSIAEGLYAYVGAAFSNSSIFSKNRFGLSLYKGLPYSFEAEGGVRYLKFSNSTTILYVVGLGRYMGNNFVGMRSYITPGGDNQYSKSFNFYSRFYLSDDRNDYFGINGGSGFSPDDRARNVAVNRDLKSLKAGLEYSRNVNKHLIISGSLSYLNEEYRITTFGNQFTISAGINHRF